MGKPSITPPRRILTGHDAQGRSIIVEDGPAPSCLQPDHSPNLLMCDVWEIPAFPPDNADTRDLSLRPVRLMPPPAGAVFRVIEFPPDKERNWGGIKHVFEQYGAPEALDAHADARHPGFHKTASQDFAICLSGEIWAMMDEGETLMKPGDVLIQRGTNHAWSNRTNKPARMAFVLISAAPVEGTSA